jgi:hypothetical protein
LLNWILGELICEAVKWAEINQCFIQGCVLILTAQNLLVTLLSPVISPISTNEMESHVFLHIKFDKPYWKAFHIDFTLSFRHSNR